MEDKKKKVNFSQGICLPKNASKRTRKQQNPPPLPNPSHDEYIGWERGANVAARGEGAPVDWEPGGHDVGKHNKDGAFVVSTSVVGVVGHHHRIGGHLP